MSRALRHISVWCCGVGLLVVFASPATAGLGKPAAAEWLPPTPTEGKRFRVMIGEQLRVSLIATTREAPGVDRGDRGIRRARRRDVQDDRRQSGGRHRHVGPHQGTGGSPVLADVHGRSRRPRHRRCHTPRRGGGSRARDHVHAQQRGNGDVPLRVHHAEGRRQERARPNGSTGRQTPPADPRTHDEPRARARRTSNGECRLDPRQAPVLPNNTTGWVPRRTLSAWKVVRTHLVVDRSRLTAILYRLGRPVFFARVGVGRPQWPTPPGEFYVRNQLYGYDDPFYGPIAFRNECPVIGVDRLARGRLHRHPRTDQPQLIPGHVSHGCIRLRNPDILRLAKLMPVGTLTLSSLGQAASFSSSLAWSRRQSST